MKTSAITSSLLLVFLFTSIGFAQPPNKPTIGFLDIPATVDIVDTELDNDGSLYIAGNFTATFTFQGQTITHEGLNDALIIKLDASGNYRWHYTQTNADNDIEFTDILISPNSIFATGALDTLAGNSVFSVLKISKTDGSLTESIGFDPALADAGNASRGLQLGMDGTNLYAGVYFTGIFDVAVGNNGINADSLTANGGDDLIIFEVDTTFTDDNLSFVRFGNETAPEDPSRMRFTNGNGQSFVGYETTDANYIFGATSFAKSPAISRVAIVRRFTWSNSTTLANTFVEQSLPLNTLDGLVYSSQSDRLVVLFNKQELIRITSNLSTLSNANFMENSRLDGFQFVDIQLDRSQINRVVILGTYTGPPTAIYNSASRTTYPAGDISISNIYKIDMILSSGNANFGALLDVDNMGEFNGDIAKTHFALNLASLKEYSLISTISAGTNINLALSNLENSSGSERRYLVGKPNQYFEFIEPLDEDTLRQFGIDTLRFYGYDVSGSINRGNSSNPNVSTVGPIATGASSLGQTTPLFGSTVFNNSSGTVVGDIFFHLPGTGALDTVNVLIEQAGRITTPSNSSFINILAKRDKTQPIVIGNTGTAPLQISSFALQSDSLFSVSGSVDIIPIGGSDTLFVTFSPRAAGAVNNSLIIQSDAGNGNVSIPISGTSVSVAPGARFATDSTATLQTNPFNPFSGVPNTQIGEADTVATFIVNAGTDTLDLSTFVFARGTSFRLSAGADSASTLLPTPENPLVERIRRIDIIFEPDEFRVFKDTLFIQSNDSLFAEGRIVIPITASGTDSLGRLQSSGEPLIISSVLSENDTAYVQFQLTNTGFKDLIIQSANFTSDFLELGDSLTIVGTDTTFNPFTQAEVSVDQSINVALRARPNLYELPNDTTITDILTINHTGSGGRSTFEIKTSIVKTFPILQFKQNFTNTQYFLESGEAIIELDQVPIQTLREQNIELYNMGNDTLNLERVVVFPIANSFTENLPEIFFEVDKTMLLPGDTAMIDIEFELLGLRPFGIEAGLFTNAERIIGRRSQFEQTLSEFDSDGEFKFLYSGTGVVPNLRISLREFDTDTLHPSFVNILFQATDALGGGITFLDQPNPNVMVNGQPKSNFFTLREGSRVIEPNDAESEFQIIKRDAIDFEVVTALVLDNSLSIAPDDIPLIRDAAVALVRDIADDQRIAIYTFSETVQLVQDFTADTTLLINAIRNINRDAPSTNLFGAMIDAANRVESLLDFTFGSIGDNQIVDGNIVVFTDGAETTNDTPERLAQVQAAIGSIPVYAVGVGDDIDIGQLNSITRNSGRVFDEPNVSGLIKVFRNIQREINKIANSFYTVNYISPARSSDPNDTRTVEVTVDGNTNGASDFRILSSFSPFNFTSVSPQVVVNQSFPNIFGDDTLFIPVNLETLARATSILNFDPPGYKWESANEEIIRVNALPPDGNQAILTPFGNLGDETTVTVTDTVNVDGPGNPLTKTIVVILGEAVSQPAVTINVAAGQTGTFDLDQNGSALTINSNNGDGFTLSAIRSINPGGETPNGIEVIFDDFYYIINLTTSGSVDIDYEITFDVSGIDFSDESDATVLKREDSSSEWQNVRDIANTTVSIQNGLLKVTGLASFSDFAIAEESNTVSNERESDFPTTFTLNQNYPNPFNPSTIINFGLPNASDVRIDLFNIIGQRVISITNQRYSAGWHNVTFNASGLASGIYIYRIQAGSFVETKRMTLIK